MSAVTPRELAALSDGVVGALKTWCASSAARECVVDDLPLADLVGGGLVVAGLAALKQSFLEARSERPGSRKLSRLTAVLGAGPEFWRAARRGDFSRAPVGSESDPPPAPAPERGGLLALENYRNRVAFDRLGEGGLALTRRERLLWSGEPSATSPARPDAAAVWRELLEAFPRESCAEMPQAPGWDGALALEGFLRTEGLKEIDLRLDQAAAWRAYLRKNRFEGALGGIPWGGELRVAALVALSEGLPFLAMQDGALSEVGVGGFPPPTSALAWGAAGKNWFVEKGLDQNRVAAVGDPYLEQWVAQVAGTDEAQARAELGLPSGERIVLAAFQNTAPHTLIYDPRLPLEVTESIARAVARTPGWHLVIKPHPRLPLVDGLPRLAEGWSVARRYGATMLSPFARIDRAVAACDAYVSDGDTLTLEVLRTGRPALIWSPPGHTPPYADFLDGSLPTASSSAELSSQLKDLPEVSAGDLLARHLAPEEGILKAIERLVRPDSAAM